ncbi:MAG: DUF3300 domain-containing protein [Proteobacteria bacterium]|nr:DUF3300 domain-containing protein [Pseudomonadota bacterium]
MLRRTLLILPATFLAIAAERAALGQDKPAFKPEELDQLLAPVALYPDALLSQVLMAATYPLEVVEAARWSKANPNLKGDAAVNAVKDKDWDVSVKSLVAFPSVLAQMNDHLDWTQKLGDAMVSQQQDVADSIQRLRAKAAAAGNLKSTPQQTVTTQGSGSSVQYVIEPANPEVIYVPSYNPSWAYGSWPYPAYPPVYYPPAVGALASGFFWGLGFAAAGAMFGGWHWGGYGNSYVNVNVNRAVNIDNHYNRTAINADGRWQHDPTHRRGVGYRDAATRQRFGQGPRPGVDQRQQFRGRLENGPGANRPQTANRGPMGQPGGQRPNLPQQHSMPQNRGGAERPSALSGVNRGQQINREAQRGQMQMNRAQSHPNFREGGGGGGGRAGGGGFHGGGGRR